MMPNVILLIRRKIKNRLLIAIIILFVAFGLLVAKTVTKPLDVELRTYIKICKEIKKGSWEVIDEVGPSNLRFNASLLEMAKGQNLKSDFVWKTKSKKGHPYNVRLLGDAKTNLKAATRRFDVDLMFEITYAGKKATVPGKLTTDALFGPLGGLRGQPIKGILGKDATTMKLVSVNKFQPSSKSKPLMLVCTEEYKFSPKK